MRRRYNETPTIVLLSLSPTALAVEDPKPIDDFLYDPIASTEELRDIIFENLPQFEALLLCRAFGIGELEQSLSQIAQTIGATPAQVIIMRDSAIATLREDPEIRERIWIHFEH